MHESEVSKILQGDCDPAAICSYLAIDQKPEELAKLAAMMAPRQDTFDPKALADAALALQGEVEAAQVRKRETVLELMNYRTLLALARKLKVLGPEDREKKSHDPVAGPVVRRQRAIEDASTENSRARNAAQIGEAFATADERTQIERPQVPCELIAALRYAADAGTPLDENLMGAFIDFFRVFISEENQKIEAEREETTKDQMSVVSGALAEIPKEKERIIAKLAEIRSTKESTPDSDESLRQYENALKRQDDAFHEHERRLKELKQDLASIEDAKTYRREFKPGAQAPASLAKQKDNNFATHWDRPKLVEENSLAWLCSEFYAFWQEHGDAYLSRYEESVKEERAKAKRASEAGKKGVEKRERQKWLRLTDSLVEFTNGQGGLPSQKARTIFLQRFVSERAGAKSKSSQDRVFNFFNVLCANLDKAFDDAAIPSRLRKFGLVNVPEEAARECHDLLQLAFLEAES